MACFVTSSDENKGNVHSSKKHEDQSIHSSIHNFKNNEHSTFNIISKHLTPSDLAHNNKKASSSNVTKTRINHPCSSTTTTDTTTTTTTASTSSCHFCNATPCKCKQKSDYFPITTTIFNTNKMNPLLNDSNTTWSGGYSYNGKNIPTTAAAPPANHVISTPTTPKTTKANHLLSTPTKKHVSSPSTPKNHTGKPNCIKSPKSGKDLLLVVLQSDTLDENQTVMESLNNSHSQNSWSSRNKNCRMEMDELGSTRNTPTITNNVNQPMYCSQELKNDSHYMSKKKNLSTSTSSQNNMNSPRKSTSIQNNMNSPRKTTLQDFQENKYGNMSGRQILLQRLMNRNPARQRFDSADYFKKALSCETSEDDKSKTTTDSSFNKSTSQGYTKSETTQGYTKTATTQDYTKTETTPDYIKKETTQDFTKKETTQDFTKKETTQDYKVNLPQENKYGNISGNKALINHVMRKKKQGKFDSADYFIGNVHKNIKKDNHHVKKEEERLRRALLTAEK